MSAGQLVEKHTTTVKVYGSTGLNSEPRCDPGKGHVRNQSVEILSPPHDSNQRRSSRVVAMFNLVATVCGGGVLSLPLTFARAGIIPATILMVFAAIITDFSLYLLCICGRRTGGQSYGDVAKQAFGPVAEIGTTLILFVHLTMLLVAYMVLVKDIWTPIVLLALGKEDVDDEMRDQASNWVLVAILWVASPLLAKRDLHALRHTCYVGFTSLVVLCLSLAFSAYRENWVVPSITTSKHQIRWYSEDVSDLIFAFPIICLAYLCSFNVLSVHSALVNPTRKRVKFVLDGSISLCFVFFYIVGLFGYLCAYTDTKDNILLNFGVTDHILFFGRLGYGVTLMFSIPLAMLPCREALMDLPEQYRRWKNGDKVKDSPKSSHHGADAAEDSPISHVFDEERPLFDASDGGGSISKTEQSLTDTSDGGETGEEVPTFQKQYQRMNTEVFDDMKALKEEKEGCKRAPPMAPPVFSVLVNNQEQSPEMDPEEKRERRVFIGCTMGIVLLCYVFAVLAPGVGVVWEICGSSIGILIAFIIPTACYLKIRAHRWTGRSWWASILLCFSCLAAGVCSYQAVSNLLV